MTPRSEKSFGCWKKDLTNGTKEVGENMLLTEVPELSQQETLFMTDPLIWLGQDPVGFPVSDGSTVTVSAFATDVLREHGIDHVKVVTANGTRYLYTPFEIPDLDVLANYFGRAGRPRRWLFANFLARHVYRLHLYMAGEGRIVHNGSDSFLPKDFSREAFERLPQEQNQPERVQKEKPALVSEEVIQQQFEWLTGNVTRSDERKECAASELMREARKVASQRLQVMLAKDVVQDVLSELLLTIVNGRCTCTTREEFFRWVKGAVRNRCSDTAVEGCCNGDIFPDRLEAKMKKRGIRRGQMPEDRQYED